MVGWDHQLNGHEFEQALGDGEGHGSLLCCSLWGCKGSDMTEKLNSDNSLIEVLLYVIGSLLLAASKILSVSVFQQFNYHVSRCGSF